MYMASLLITTLRAHLRYCVGRSFRRLGSREEIFPGPDPRGFLVPSVVPQWLRHIPELRKEFPVALVLRVFEGQRGFSTLCGLHADGLGECGTFRRSNWGRGRRRVAGRWWQQGGYFWRPSFLSCVALGG
ncbi:hypothetical protein B0H11DRAFT_1325300 [Mycena galericulata]|nr:hypothetical protein B0H11DRAFT_1325300 [Mycena galericulata]